MEFKEKICDFKKFMELCIKNMIDEGEENLLKYFNDNYLSKFENLIIPEEPNNETMELSNILNQLLENNKKDKKTIEHICLTYQAIKNNLSKHSLYKKSNVVKIFLNLLKQIKLIQRNLDFNFKNIYNDYLKKLLFLFY